MQIKTNIAKFLHRLVKMLTEENNDIIEWSEGIFNR